MKYLRIFIIGIFLSLMLSGCFDPQYETVYDYQPPQDTKGRMCANQCLDSRTYCENTGQQLVLQEKQICLQEEERRAQAEYEDYLAHTKEQGKEPESNYYDFYQAYSCDYLDGSSNEQKCENNYNACYQNCGGQVTSQTFCVANCDEEGK